MIKGILLDIDGTLLDSNQAHVRTWVHTFDEFGYKVTGDEVRTLIGMGGDRIIPALIPGLSAEEGIGKEISDYRKKCVTECLSEVLQPTPGARDLVLSLKKRNIKLIVATSSSKEEVQLLLQCAEVDDLVEDYITSSDVKSSKPSPDVTELALKKLKLSSNEVMMLGDAPYDIAAAKKSGIKTIALRSGGFSDNQLKGATHIFNDPKDVVQHLDALLHTYDETQFHPHLM